MGKGKLWPLANQKPIVTKFEWRDYVVDFYHQKKLGSIRPGFLLPI